MGTKTISLLSLLLIMMTVTIGSVNAANHIISQQDQGVVTTSWSWTQDSLGNPIITPTVWSWSSTATVTPVDLWTTATTVVKAPLKDVFYSTPNTDEYKFDFDVEDATEVYATTFESVNKDMTINNLKITGKNWEDVSQDIKDSFLIVIKRIADGQNEMFTLPDINNGGVTLSAGDIINLIYNADGFSNWDEISILNNVLDISMTQTPKPISFWIATLDDNLNVSFNNETKLYTLNANNTVLPATPIVSNNAVVNIDNTWSIVANENIVNDKKILIKTDTGPVETVSLLLLALLTLVSFGIYKRKQS